MINLFRWLCVHLSPRVPADEHPGVQLREQRKCAAINACLRKLGA